VDAMNFTEKANLMANHIKKAPGEYWGGGVLGIERL